jgi:radical SAM superfamily enzyme YgiQ (UPF0313 family)
MRVLLLNPTAYFEVLGSNPAALEQSRGHSPPLGLLHLAGYLEQHTDHEVAILDTQAEELDFQRVATRVRRARPDVVGITAMTQTLIDVVRAIELVRAEAPSARVVIGGPHAHLFPEETACLPGVDFVVLGEGEQIFAQLLERLDDPAELESLPGLVFARGEELIDTGRPGLIDDLDALPFPARHLTDVTRYDSVLAPRHPVTTMFTSRGCPHVCSFCDRPHLGKRFRARSAPSVVDEMEQCVELGVSEFLIYDDTFTIRRQRVIDICEEILARGLDVGFDVRSRVDTVDPEMLRLMARAGCRGLHYGVESGSERTLEVLRKKIDLATARSVFTATKRAGMQVLAYFMIGCPGETREEIRQTFRVARQLDPDFLHLTILTPFPGTEIYRDGLRSGVIERDVWREFAARPHLGFTPPHWSENFTLEELDDLLLEGYRGFYRRPSYLLKRVAKVRSINELLRKTKAGLRILTMRSKTGR